MANQYHLVDKFLLELFLITQIFDISLATTRLLPVPVK